MEAPDLATVKDFLRFHAAASKGKIKEKITSDSLNTFAEWFFAGFSRVTETQTDADDRSEVYDLYSLLYLTYLHSTHIKDNGRSHQKGCKDGIFHKLS